MKVEDLTPRQYNPLPSRADTKVSFSLRKDMKSRNKAGEKKFKTSGSEQKIKQPPAHIRLHEESTTRKQISDTLE
jgi:transposase